MNRQRYAIMIMGMFMPILILSLFLNGSPPASSPVRQPTVTVTITSPQAATSQPKAPTGMFPQPALPTPTAVSGQNNPSILTS